MKIKVAILSIQAHILRAYSTLGHLETIGFNVFNDVRIHEGVDYREDLQSYGAEMKREGFDEAMMDYFLEYQAKRGGGGPHTAAFNLGYLRILKHIADGEYPTLLISSDVIFKSDAQEITKHPPNLSLIHI